MEEVEGVPYLKTTSKYHPVLLFSLCFKTSKQTNMRNSVTYVIKGLVFFMDLLDSHLFILMLFSYGIDRNTENALKHQL